MDIHSDSYQVASLNEQESAVELIRQAEEGISRLTGQTVTLIAYEKKEDRRS